MRLPKATKLPSGSWNVRLMINGKVLSITKPTKAEAVTEALAVREGLKCPEPTLKNITLARAVDQYIELCEGVLSPSTIRGYKAIKRLQFGLLMPCQLNAITKSQYQAAINNQARTLSPKTVKNGWGLIASVLKKNDIPVPDVRLPAQQHNEHPYLTDAQIPIFVDAIKDKSVELPALLGLHSLRRSEICGLTWEQVDLKNDMLHICESVVFDSDGELVNKKKMKNSTSKRDVPILIPRLRELLTERQQKTGKVVNCHPNTIYKAVNTVCAANDLPPIGTHGLRHSFASLCWSLGVPEEITMRLAGWADYQTMHKRYLHFSEAQLKKDAEKISNFFKPKPKICNGICNEQTAVP